MDAFSDHMVTEPVASTLAAPPALWIGASMPARDQKNVRNSLLSRMSWQKIIQLYRVFLFPEIN